MVLYESKCISIGLNIISIRFSCNIRHTDTQHMMWYSIRLNKYLSFFFRIQHLTTLMVKIILCKYNNALLWNGMYSNIVGHSASLFRSLFNSNLIRYTCMIIRVYIFRSPWNLPCYRTYFWNCFNRFTKTIGPPNLMVDPKSHQNQITSHILTTELPLQVRIQKFSWKWSEYHIIHLYTVYTASFTCTISAPMGACWGLSQFFNTTKEINTCL